MQDIKLSLATPGIIALIVSLIFMPQLEYHIGNRTNYSIGISVYTLYGIYRLYMELAQTLIPNWQSCF